MFCGGFGPSGYGTLGSGWLLAMGIRVLIFAALIITAIKLFKNYSNNSHDIMRILDENFASGQITEEEYLKRKSILSQKH